MGIGNGILFQYANQFRSVYITGRFGGGKTALAFYIAYRMVKDYGYRYVISNTQSVWTEPPENVVLRDGLYADAVVILDEGGQFLSNTREATKWWNYMRKLNMVLIMPSVDDVAPILRRVSVMRTFNGNAFALPFWRYELDLKIGSLRERMPFTWWYPDEIFAIYDTMAFPTVNNLTLDAEGILEYVNKWTAQSAQTAQKIANDRAGFELRQEYSRSTELDHAGSTSEDVAGYDMDEIIRLSDAIRENEATMEHLISLQTAEGRKKRGSRRGKR